jgi:hypothetical protein
VDDRPTVSYIGQLIAAIDRLMEDEEAVRWLPFRPAPSRSKAC